MSDLRLTIRDVWIVVMAVAAAVGGAGYLAGFGIGWSVALAVLTPALPAFLRGLLRGVRTPAAREAPAASAASMTGVEFEEYVARIARSTGASVIMTQLSGDFGVDLVVGRRPHRVAVQCKRQSRPVGPSAVQEVVAGAAMHDCAHTMVVTNHEFTSAAVRLAERHGCILVGGTELTRLGTTMRRLVNTETAQRD